MGKEDKENMVDEQSMREHWLSDLAPLSDAAQQRFSGQEVPMSEEETADLLDEAEFRFPKNKPISQSEDALIQEALVLGGPVDADRDPDAPQLSEEKMQTLLREVTRQLGTASNESVPTKTRKIIPFKSIFSTLGVAAAVMLGFFIFKGDPSVDPGAVAQDQIDTMPQGGAIVLAFNGEAQVSELDGDEKMDFRTLENGDLLAPGMELKTGAEGEAVLLFTNGSLATLGPDSQMRLSEFTQEAFEGTEEKVSELTEEPSESQVLLELDLGELVVEVKKLDKQSSFDLYSHLGFAGIRGTQYRALATDRSVRLSVLEGKVAVSKERGGLYHLIDSERAILLEEDLQKEPDGATVEELERIKRVNERARKLAEKIKLKDLAEAYDEINKRLASVLEEKELEQAMNKAIDEGTYIVESAANMEMIWCKPGTFMMGNPAGKNRPQQKVTLSDGFFLGRYEVTQEEYEKVMGNNPSQIKGNKFAVSSIRGGKYDISKFCTKLTERESNSGRLPFGWVFTLPTEEEWEYACRAGTTTDFFWGDDKNQSFVNYENVFEGQPIEVGSFKPNPWGFHDMHGNMWEWIKGHYTRGGGNLSSSYKRIAGTPAVGQYEKMGFRLCLKRLLDDEKQAGSDINLLTPDALEIKDNWVLEDGVMTVRQSKQKGNIWTKEKFGDFKLSLEYKTSAKANSGLFFRADPVDPVQRGFEIQIASPGLYNGNTVVGSLYGAMAPMVEAGKPDGEWNSMELICDGQLIKAQLNGQEILDLNIDDWKDAGKNPDGTINKFKSPLKDLPRSGLIGFQYYGQQIWFRNVIIRSLESEDIIDLKTSIEEKFEEAMKKPVGEGIHIVESAANMEMIWCKPGSFEIGKKQPKRKVSLTKGFYLGKYEVTQEQYEKVMDENPSDFKGKTLPVEMVSWIAAKKFCEKLNGLEKKEGNAPDGWVYTLPSETEWEYACRAGTTSAYSWGDNIVSSNANYNWDGGSTTGKDYKQTRGVGQYSANPWGFFDMHGNVWEWTANYLTAQKTAHDGPKFNSKQLRMGGSWYHDAKSLQSDSRFINNRTFRSNSLGFRLCLKQIKEEVKQASIPDKVNLSEGLAGWWKFDETKGKIAKDSSGKNRNGELKDFDSDTAQWVKGPVGNAISLDGKNDYIDVGDFEWGGEFSFSAWVKYKKFQNWSRVFDFGVKAENNDIYLTNGKSQSNKFHLTVRAKSVNGLHLENVLDSNTWYHLAFSLDSKGYLTAYSQGKIIAPQKRIVPAKKMMRKNQFLGKSQFEKDAYLNGILDDFRIYDRAINETEINALFAMGNPKGIKAGFVEGKETVREENNNSLISEQNNQAKQSQEPVRIFKSAQGSLFEGRVLSYEGNNFFLEGKDSKIISVTLNQLSKEDQKYLNETLQAGKIGTDNPHENGSLPVEGNPWTLPSIGMEMIWCEPGNFMMGDNDKVEGQKNPYSGKKSPSHKVTFTKGFFLGKYEVTQEQFQKVMGKNPSEFKDNKHPVEKVTWKDAVAFCEILTANEKKVGWKFSLPTESQWEYACRAGTNTKYSWGNTISLDMANYGATGLKKTMSVGSYRSNPWGFFDMHGNVYEWCTDWFKSYPQGPRTDPQGPSSGSLKVIRGGAWRRIGDSAMSAHREYRKPEQYRYHDLGFRVCLMQVKEEVKQSSISGKVNLNDD